MPLPLTLPYILPRPGQPFLEHALILDSGFTTIFGPNGAGKTQLMRQLKQALVGMTEVIMPEGREIPRKVRYLSGERLHILGSYRTIGSRYASVPDYDSAHVPFSSEEKEYLHLFEDVRSDLHNLDIRPDLLIKVGERLRKLLKRDVFPVWKNGQLTIEFKKTDATQAPYSIGREASGLLHVVAILAALYDDAVYAFLLNEPEISLHPQLQAFVLRELKSFAGDPTNVRKKLIFIATH